MREKTQKPIDEVVVQHVIDLLQVALAGHDVEHAEVRGTIRGVAAGFVRANSVPRRLTNEMTAGLGGKRLGGRARELARQMIAIGRVGEFLRAIAPTEE